MTSSSDPEHDWTAEAPEDGGSDEEGSPQDDGSNEEESPQDDGSDEESPQDDGSDGEASLQDDGSDEEASLQGSPPILPPAAKRPRAGDSLNRKPEPEQTIQEVHVHPENVPGAPKDFALVLPVIHWTDPVLLASALSQETLQRLSIMEALEQLRASFQAAAVSPALPSEVKLHAQNCLRYTYADNFMHAFMGACGVRKSTIVELRDPRHAGAYIHCPRLSLQHILAVRRKCYIRISGGPFAAVPPTVQEEYDQHYIDMGRFSALSSYQGFLPLLRILLTREPSINVFLSQLWVTITTESAQWNEDTKCLSRIMAATLTDFAVMMRRSDFNRTSERTFWVESVVPMFKYFAAETNYITFSWCGADVVSHSDSQLIPGVWLNETTQLLADGLGQAGRFEVLIMESSSGYEQEIPQRTVDGTIKVTRCMIDSLRMERNKYNFASFETAKRLATFGIQCVCNKITLLQANMFDENTWQIVEVRSAEIPTKWEDRTAMMSVAEFLAKLQLLLKEQEAVKKRLKDERYNIIPVNSWDKLESRLQGRGGPPASSP